MASVERRERTTVDGRAVVRYVVRWRDPHGAQKTKSFGCRGEAERFRRSDEQFQRDLQVLGDVVAFDTWNWFGDGGHYQWARVVTR
jgi:hypothetical protein